MSVSSSFVRTRRHDGIGDVRLDRPAAINALNIEMIQTIDSALEAWSADPDVTVILLSGEGERGFCAGGDVRALYDHLVAGDVAAVGEYFRTEYALNLRIATSRTPIVAFADGITMGGGIGLAGHAAVRIVTERSRLAMPETRIGLTPDVGGSFLLSRAPGRLGEYLALTGAVMDASDAIAVGLADAFVPAERLDDVRDALMTRADPSTPAEMVLLFDETPGPSALMKERAWIDDAFAAPTVAEIVARLDARDEEEARTAARILREVSPTSLAVTLASVRRARELPDLRAALAHEYALVSWLAATQPDLVEGIRAQLVDKDRSPRWNPATIDDLPAGLAEAALSFVPAPPLWG